MILTQRIQYFFIAMCNKYNGMLTPCSLLQYFSKYSTAFHFDETIDFLLMHSLLLLQLKNNLLLC